MWEWLSYDSLTLSIWIAGTLSVVLSTAAKAWTFHHSYIRTFTLSSLKNQIEHTKTLNNSEIQELLETLYMEELAGIYLGKRLPLLRQKIVMSMVDSYVLEISTLRRAWDYVKFDDTAGVFYLNYGIKSVLGLIYYFGLFIILLGFLSVGVYKLLMGGNTLIPSSHMLIFSLLILWLFSVIRSSLAAMRLKKQITSA